MNSAGDSLRVGHPVDGGGDGVLGDAERLADHLVLAVGEVEVERAARGAALLDDLLHARGVVALALDQRHGRAEHALARVGLPWHAVDGTRNYVYRHTYRRVARSAHRRRGDELR